LGRGVRTAPEERFAALARSSKRRAGVTSGRMFGSEGLKVDEKTFAMLAKGRLVVKLPASRVEELIGEGLGERFDPGHGRLMKEWLAVAPDADLDWGVIANEAFAYVKAVR
jgi:TfoX/Sxy family transcriptional regulator of competence genes